MAWNVVEFDYDIKQKNVWGRYNSKTFLPPATGLKEVII